MCLFKSVVGSWSSGAPSLRRPTCRHYRLPTPYSVKPISLSEWRQIYPVSRIYPINHSGEGDDLTYVLRAADPGYRALQAEAEARVGDAAVAAQIQIPLEGVHG